jgi:hypothetical protein
MKLPALCTRILPVLGLAVLGAAAGCRDRSPSPARPAARPSAATTADPNAPPGAPTPPPAPVVLAASNAVDASATEIPPPTPETTWRRAPLDAHSWSLTADPPPPPSTLPPCPSGTFCTTAAAPASPSPGMPAPPTAPGRCPANVQTPASLNLAPLEAIITFDADTSARESLHRARACCYRWVRLCQPVQAPQGNAPSAPPPRGG